MEPDELIRLYPRLHHVAEPGSWDSINHRGLLTSAQLCELFDVPPAARVDLLERRRPAKAQLDHPVHGRVVLRDQGPLSSVKLARCLQGGVTVEQWLARLNQQVFFWLQENRLNRMLNAYADQEHDVLTVDTASLLAVHGERVRLSRINSGSTAYAAQPRGTGTFLPVADYPHPTRRHARASAGDVAELTVLDGVPDLSEHVVLVQRRHGTEILSTLYERDPA